MWKTSNEPQTESEGPEKKEIQLYFDMGSLVENLFSQLYGRFGHVSTKIDENTNSNYSFNCQYIGILSDQTLENSHSDILIRRILIFWEIE